MKKIVNYTYKAFDGKVFDTEEECIEYEKSVVDISNIIEILKRTRDICHSFECFECPLRSSNNNSCPASDDVPENWYIE